MSSAAHRLLLSLIVVCSAARGGLAQTTDVVDFENDVQPILTRFGCNSGPCHGKARGQGGFQLSLLAFDAQQDYDAIVKEGRGRRVFAGAADESLLVTKPTGLVPHGGGKRLDPNGPETLTLKTWIQQGMPRKAPAAPTLKKITVDPSSQTLAPEQSQQLQVTAEFSDGTQRDVTRLTAFQSNEAPIAAVSEDGMITAGKITGDAAIMARFMGQIAVCDVIIPRTQPVPAETYAALPRNNFVDDLVWQKLQRLNITPSPVCDDHTFIRRATTDICGRIPTQEEVQAFLADSSPDKRSRLVDHLLQQPDFADFWANKWVDLLRPNPYRVGIKAVFNYDHWIRQSFHDRKPWDQFVRELITAKGSTFRNGAVTMFRDRREPEEITTMVSRLFVGVRLECAKCHHHPFEVWGQEDFYSFAAYFAKIGRKGTGLSPPISGSEEFFFTGTRGSVSHPVTGAKLDPRPLFGTAPEVIEGKDARESLAAWITSPENHLFAQVMANRVWADLTSRGLVEPVDDFRATNPASNGPLLKALGEHFRDSGFSLTELVRVIAKSHVYQLSSLPNETNSADTRNYSRHYRHRLRAEVLLDSVTLVTGIPQEFEAMPPDSNSRQIWTHRADSLFLDTFGRPDPNQDPPCERTTDSTVVQSLHLMNSEQLYRDVTSDKAFAKQLADSNKDADTVAKDLYQKVFSRNPVPEETQLVRDLLAAEGANRRQVIEDLVWAMLNSAEFVIQD
ncbi:MAG: DUF1549 domain-containing protein [Planctomycetaceae bacterium]|nr:DUF1549 domain-containing protein [Planctomycetaceae bacterium]